MTRIRVFCPSCGTWAPRAASGNSRLFLCTCGSRFVLDSEQLTGCRREARRGVMPASGGTEATAAEPVWHPSH